MEGIFSYDMLRNLLLWAITLHYSDEIYAPNKPVVHYCDFRKLGGKSPASVCKPALPEISMSSHVLGRLFNLC